MATLNVKDFPDRLYRKLRMRAKAERRSLSQEVVLILSQELLPQKPRSLLDLRGLGKEVWREVNSDPVCQ